MAADNFSNVYPITFHGDQCGSGVLHAAELKNMIDKILADTGKTKVNIVAHSKGGLDARWYIANNNIDKVANLVMIATPNAGTPAAYFDFTIFFPNSADLIPGSVATQATDKPQSTNYYTIAGHWLSNDRCLFPLYNGDNCFILGHDDRLVPIQSVQSSHNYTLLGIFPYEHNQLVQQKDVYDKVGQQLRD